MNLTRFRKTLFSFGQIKIYKSGLPIRPVIAFYSPFTYTLWRYLSARFRHTSSFKYKFTIKYLYDLAGKLTP